MVTELSADQAYKVCGPENVGCDSSQELTALETIVGQDRALRAMQFGLGIKEQGLISTCLARRAPVAPRLSAGSWRK